MTVVDAMEKTHCDSDGGDRVPLVSEIPTYSYSKTLPCYWSSINSLSDRMVERRATVAADYNEINSQSYTRGMEMDGNRGGRLTDGRRIATCYSSWIQQPTALSGEIQQSTIPWRGKSMPGVNPDIHRQGSGIVIADAR